MTLRHVDGYFRSLDDAAVALFELASEPVGALPSRLGSPDKGQRDLAVRPHLDRASALRLAKKLDAQLVSDANGVFTGARYPVDKIQQLDLVPGCQVEFLRAANQRCRDFLPRLGLSPYR